MSDSPSATLTITRNAADDVQDRWVRIYLDDGPEHILRFGETLALPINPGPHRLKAHNTLSMHTIELHADPGQDLRVKCFNRFSRGSAIMLLTIGFGYISVRLEVE